MARRTDAARRIFLRYAANNILILQLPMLAAAVYYRVSIRAIPANVDDIAVRQLETGMSRIDGQFADIRNMSIQLSNDYEINYYLSIRGRLEGIELYNLKRISEKLFSFVLGNGVLSHCYLYLHGSGVIVFESGFSLYESFYGPLFSAAGYTAAQWRDDVLRSPDGDPPPAAAGRPAPGGEPDGRPVAQRVRAARGSDRPHVAEQCPPGRRGPHRPEDDTDLLLPGSSAGRLP